MLYRYLEQKKIPLFFDYSVTLLIIGSGVTFFSDKD